MEYRVPIMTDKNKFLEIMKQKLIDKPILVTTDIFGEEVTDSGYHGRVINDKIEFMMRPSYTQGLIKEILISVEKKNESMEIVASWNEMDSNNIKILIIAVSVFLSLLIACISIVKAKYNILLYIPLVLILGIIFGILSKNISKHLNKKSNDNIRAEINNLIIGL